MLYKAKQKIVMNGTLRDGVVAVVAIILITASQRSTRKNCLYRNGYCTFIYVKYFCHINFRTFPCSLSNIGHLEQSAML